MALDIEVFLRLISPEDATRVDMALGTVTGADRVARFDELARVADAILLGHCRAAGYAVPLALSGVTEEDAAAQGILDSMAKDLILLEISAGLDRTPEWVEAAKSRADLRVQQLVGTANPYGGREGALLILPGVTRA